MPPSSPKNIVSGPRGLIWAAALGIVLSGLALGCAASLPEEDSRAAHLYVQYCSGSGCHGPIPPERATPAVWQMQTDRMLVLMRDTGFPLPSRAQTDTIMAYLSRHAEGVSP